MTSTRHDDAFGREFPALADALRGQFHVERELGRGGMGVVYLARDERLDRMVALKVLPAALAAEPQTRERFLREARTAARLAHPNIVPVYRADEAGGSAYFAMAYVDGESLADRVRDRGPCPPPTRCRSSATSPGRWPTPTRAAWCTATSSRRTSSSSARRSAARGGPSSRTSASRTTRPATQPSA
jgi:serine/threonine protein kinase